MLCCDIMIILTSKSKLAKLNYLYIFISIFYMADRISLHYPAINVPNNDWVRSSLLYSDKISSIVPFETMHDRKISLETQYLYDEGEYIPTSVFGGLDNQFSISEFEKTFFQTMESEAFRNILQNQVSLSLNRNKPAHDFGLYLNKLTRNISDYLHQNNLVQYETKDKLLIDKSIAILYMSLLAVFLSKDISKGFIVPTTDKKIFEDIAFKMSDVKVSAHQLILNNCLPVPAPNVDFKKIITFKKSRRQELLKFRQQLEDLRSAISNTTEEEEKHYYLIRFKEKMEMEVIDMIKIYGDSKIDFLLNSCSALFNFKQKESLGTLGSLGLANIPLHTSLPIIGLANATILLTGTTISAYNKMNHSMSNHDFSFIYLAKKQRVV